MELKQLKNYPLTFVLFLLIVPYGIETSLSVDFQRIFRLLIVPYGIETASRCFVTRTASLLIVPYGIETN